MSAQSTIEPRRVGRPARLARPDVVRAAVDVVEEHGVDALTLRAVAKQLGVTPASLYRLVDGPEGLHRMVVESLLDEAVEALVLPGEWRPALEALAHLVRSTLLKHPLLVQAYSHGLVRSEGADQAIDDVLGALLDAGLDESQVVDVYSAVHGYVVGFTALEHRRSALPPEVYALSGEGSGAPRVREAFTERYYSPDSFDAGLALILEGVERLLHHGGGGESRP